MTANETSTRRFGRCPEKSCRTRVVDHGQFADDVLATQDGGYITGTPLAIAKNRHAGVAHLLCASHKLVIRWSNVKSQITNQECGRVCREATSEDCKCSCGGANHGEFA